MITSDDLLKAGFVQQIKEMQGEVFETNIFYLSGWSPLPSVNWEDRNYGPVIQIGGMQRRVNTVEELEKFVNKAVPMFCDYNG